jgi:hypothetical protein
MYPAVCVIWSGKNEVPFTANAVPSAVVTKLSTPNG